MKNLNRMTNEELRSYYKEVSRYWAIAGLKEDLEMLKKIEVESYRRDINLW